MLSLDAVARTVGDRTLFENVHWTINPGERIGLVGPNGCGKTTLLRIIAGEEGADAGRVVRRGRLRVAYLPQEVEAEVCDETSVLDAALAGAGEVRAIGIECERLAGRMAELAAAPGEEEELARVSQEYGERRALFEWAGGDDLEARARIVLGGLGFSEESFAQSVRTLSGGWRMRVLMARMLLSGAGLLLLDEPTNHLDLDALAWLESYLASSPAGIVVVSHDRVFLDRVATRIADLVSARLRLTTGAYSAWVAARTLEREQTEKRARQLALEEERLARFVARFRGKPTKTSQAADRQRMLDRVRAERAELRLDPSLHWRIRWPRAVHSHEIQVTLDGVGKRFGEKVVIEDVDLEIRRGDRLAVLGPNGAGKTTLLRILAGEEHPTSGRRMLAPGLEIGRFAQHQLDTMDPSRTVLDEVARGIGERKPEELRRALGSLGLGEEHVERTVGTLSGGERARLALSRLLLRPASLLLLDEPTNHLDLPLREALETALEAWDGSLLVVSHDRAFLSRITRGVLAIESGRVERIDGGWQEWLEWRARVRGAVVSEPAPAPTHARSREGRRARAEALQQRNRRLRPLREEVAHLEAEIERAGQALAATDAALTDPAIHADGERMRELGRERERLAGRIAELESRWAEAAHDLEEAERGLAP